MKKIIFMFMISALLAATGIATAQSWGKGSGMDLDYGPHSRGAGFGASGLWRALNLAPEQVEKMKALRKSFFEQALPLRNELRSKKFELKALWVQTNPDEGKILNKQKEINALKAQLQEKTTKNRLEMRNVLTPEQQAQLIYSLNRYSGWHGSGKGHEFDPCFRQYRHHRHHLRDREYF